MQAADIIFSSTAYPLNVLQIPLHKLMGTGYLAAAIACWTLKVHLRHSIPPANLLDSRDGLLNQPSTLLLSVLLTQNSSCDT